MPKLRVLSGKEVCEIMSQQGFQQVRQKGSHIKRDCGRKHPPPEHRYVSSCVRQFGQEFSVQTARSWQCR